MIATFGSLFFSDVMGFIPCSLCWYQRILMYPLVIILGIGYLKSDKCVFLYSLPIALIGWAIAIYHNLLQWKIIPETIAPCKQGVPCSATYVNYFGFITIPLMSLIAFTCICAFLLLFNNKKELP